MRRAVVRYSECFRRQVVAELESGRFGSVAAAAAHYEIRGATTIPKWLRRYGRLDLLPKVVRVEKPDEADRLAAAQRRIAELERALGQTQARGLLNEAYLERACQQLGTDVERFKKKNGGPPCTPPPTSGS